MVIVARMMMMMVMMIPGTVNKLKNNGQNKNKRTCTSNVLPFRLQKPTKRHTTRADAAKNIKTTETTNISTEFIHMDMSE